MSVVTRTEHDLIGDREIPADVYWGVHTLRALENFPITGVQIGVSPFLVESLAAVKQAAAAANLSPSRFRHLFVAQTGMSFRAYVLWARVEAAVGAAMGGLSWTEAAQDWGFADSAHLSRTCRRMFGIAPTMLIRT